MSHLGNTLLRIATVYLVVGLVMGLAMGVAGSFSLSSVHAHISLLGWAAMSITGLVYIVMPGCRESKLARLHFWGHNIGLPIMMLGLVLLTNGFQGAEKTVACGSVVVIASLAVFSINVIRNGGGSHD